MRTTEMSNPWLEIPEADYVGHMSSPAVGQRPALSRLLGKTLQSVRPHALLVLGCSTGNGLEHVNPAVTSRVVVVDVNPTYLRRLRERFPNPSFDLDVRSGDVIDIELEREAYDLVHAGLIFEYVEWPVLLPRVAGALRTGGVLSVILQAPSASSPAVTPTTFTSLRKLESLFRFVEPTALVDAARDQGLNLKARHTEGLPAGKSFEVFRFAKDAV
jgi:SAM-dependent methyltransferase